MLAASNGPSLARAMAACLPASLFIVLVPNLAGVTTALFIFYHACHQPGIAFLVRFLNDMRHLAARHVKVGRPATFAIRVVLKLKLSTSRLLRPVCAVAAGNQTNLAHLRLATNQLSGSIPSTLCTLSALETLNMSTNSLTGAP